ncbi:hypothetical protein EDB84DRAFT_1552218 [Lactarius hengduanensis]|nr:hypothetical protein EDB84DRAFT_1552218 [Lactarius hengduanensis]
MPLGLTFSFPVERTKFISGMYLGEITRNTLLALVDAAPRPILFSTSWSGGDGSEEDYAAAALVGDPEKLVPATLQRLKRQEIAQEHFGYEPCEVSLSDAALVRVSRRDRRALDGLRQRAREGRAASFVGVGGQLYAIGLDWR